MSHLPGLSNLKDLNLSLFKPLNQNNSVRLRDLIRDIRNAKSQAEERSIISKESANIRNQIASGNTKFSSRNVSKLLYIHMLGYPTQFGQMECINLIVSKGFSEKRIGYLALCILLDENQETLTLVQQALKKDLDDTNQMVQALALSVIANIGSADLCRGLSADVEKLLMHGSPYITKKALLCASRIVAKAPELIENYSEKFDVLLKDQKNVSVLLTTVQLMIDMLKQQPEPLRKEFSRHVPVLVKLLKSLATNTFGDDMDSAGVGDHFLQVKLLQVLRLLGTGNVKASELMQNVLVTVSGSSVADGNNAGLTLGPFNTSGGHCILYECIQTIFSIETDAVLRNVGINLLGKFIGNKDNNIRYVGLSTFKKVSQIDQQAVKKHLKTILECLGDFDVAIRKGTLSLISDVASRENCSTITEYLLEVLGRGGSGGVIFESDFKEELTGIICDITDRFSPSDEWRISTMLKILLRAGQYMKEDSLSSFIAAVTKIPQEQQQLTVHQLFNAANKTLLKDHQQQPSQPQINNSESSSFVTSTTTTTTATTVGGGGGGDSLARVCVWCIGEYGDLLLNDKNGQLPKATVEEVLQLLEYLLSSTDTHPYTKELIATAFAKLSVRFPSELERIKGVLELYKNAFHYGLQQRVCEYLQILSEASIDRRNDLFKKMPPVTKSQPLTIDNDNNNNVIAIGKTATKTSDNGLSLMHNSINSVDETTAAVDILDGFFSSMNPVSGGGGGGTGVQMKKQPQATNQLLGEIFSSTNVSNNQSSQNVGFPSKPSTIETSSIMMNFTEEKLFTSESGQVNDKAVSFLAWEKDQFSIEIVWDRSIPGLQTCTAYYSNANPVTSLTKFDLLIAVPKYMQVKLKKPSADIIPSNSKRTVSQEFQLLDSQRGEKPLIMKVKIKYVTSNDQQVHEENATISFPVIP